MAPVLRPEDFIAVDEQLAEGVVLTPAQLHLLRQQIDALRRINVQLRVLKYRARTGQDPPPLWGSSSGAPERIGRAGGRGSRAGGRGRGGRHGGGAWDGLVISGGRGRGRGRGRGGKRGREDESEDDDSIVVRSSEEEAEAEAAVGSSDSDEDGEEAEESQSADTSESEEDYTLPTVTQPRRTGRMRRPSSVLAAARSEGAGSSSGSEDEQGEQEEVEVEEGAGQGQQQEQQQQEDQQGEQQGQVQAPAPAGPEDEDQDQERAAGPPLSKQAAVAAPQPAKQARRSKTAAAGADSADGGGGGGSKAGKRKGLFMVVTESPAAGNPLQLPQLKPVPAFERARARAGARAHAQAGEENEGEQEEGEEEEEEGAAEAGGAAAGGDDEEELDEEEAACSVCGDAEAPEGNLILLCEGKGCSVAVHQLCYGVRKVPKNEWLCDACKAKLKPDAANCCVCPVVGCAAKKVTSLGRVVPAGGKAAAKGGKGRGKSPPLFCHLACALWVPEIELSDSENFSGVRLDKLTAVRVKLKCELCKQAGGGAVQCAFGTCCRSFHVLCGRAAGQQLQFRVTDGEPLAFCGLHSKPAFEKMVDDLVEGRRPLELAGAPLGEGEEEEQEEGDS